MASLADGTTNFVHRLPLTCVLIAFLLNKQPVVGVTYDPSQDELFYAIQGRGAYLVRRGNGDPSPTRLAVSTTTSLDRAVVSMDAGYGRTADTVDRYLQLQRALLLQNIRHVRVLGVCGITMAYVAAGRLDACLEQGSWSGGTSSGTGPKIWDLAAGKLLVQEAGGVTRDITKQETKDESLNLLERSLFCAATPELADALLATIFSA